MANWGARISIGDNFYFSSGDAVNPFTKYQMGYKKEDARKHPLICCMCPFLFRTQFTSE